MEITRTAAAEHVELKLKGRLDAIWSDHVGRALAECVRAGQHALVLDMAEVDYISSAGIRILVIVHAAAQGHPRTTGRDQRLRERAERAAVGRTRCPPASRSRPRGRPRAGCRAASSGQFLLSQPGTTAEVYDLDLNATLQVDWLGDAAAWLAGRAPPVACTSVEFPVQTLGLGLGALGAGEASAGERLGEFLAAGGAAVCQPADGTHKPDYMLLQGSLTPTVQVAYGLVGRGGFGRLLRFDKGPEQTSVPLSAVVQACLDAVGSDAVGLVMVVETAALIGAALQKTPGHPPTDQARSIFAFPDVRDWLSFTAEPALANTTSLIVGLAANAARGASLRLLKPLVRSGELHGHFHAAAFPYRPLRKGRVELAATVRPLFESEQVLGLLHLLNDWRPASGAGESRFLRGACWCAPIEP